MPTLSGKLVASGAAVTDWRGYRISADYFVDTPVPEQDEPNVVSEETPAGRAAGTTHTPREPARNTPTSTKRGAKPPTPNLVASSEQRLIEAEEDGTFSAELPTLSKDEVSLSALAPSGYLLARKTVEGRALTKPVELAVTVRKVGALTPRKEPFDGRKPSLKGRVIDVATSSGLVGRQVVILGVVDKSTAPAGAIALASAKTGANGYFSTDYPLTTGKPGSIGTPRKLDLAYALVSDCKGLDGKPEIAIVLTKVADVGSTLPTEITILVRSEQPLGTTPDCDCKTTVPRVPDAEDLANSSETYSVDLGTAGCVKLNSPNRTLEEFSFYTAVRTTDPDFVMQGSPTIDISGAAPLSPKLTMISTMSPTLMQKLSLKRSRVPLSASNAINWDNPDVDIPGLCEATSVAHGHLLHFKQVWRADGYSLGDLLYSLPLAPGQKKQIAIVDWERRETAARQESNVASEQLDSLVARDRDISEVVKTTLNEHSHGESDNLTIGSAHGSGVGGGGGGGGASFGGLAATSMSGGYSQSSATQDSLRDLTASALQRIHDQTMQAASSVRSLRTSVIQTVTQGERVSVTTEVVANHNHCHAMTMEYFEVLRHFKVTTELADVKECLYIPLPLSPFVDKKAQRWRDLLSTYLRKPELYPGFDANDRAIAAWANADVPPKRFADEQVRFMEGSLVVMVRAPRKAPGPGDTAAAFVDAAGDFIPDAVENMVKGFLNIFGDSSPPPLTTNTKLAFSVFRPDGSNELPLPLQFTLVDEFVPNKALRVRMRLAAPSSLGFITRADIGYAQIEWPDDLGDGFPDGSQLIVISATMRYHTQHIQHLLFNEPNVSTGLSVHSALIDTPLDKEELRNPQEEDRTAQRKLLKHLNEHLEYYHKAIWWSMDSDRRFMLLDAYLAPAPLGGPQRSLAAVVENRIIGFAGNSLVMPVGFGIHLDPSYYSDPENPTRLKDLYPSVLLPPSRVSLPTKGVFAEAVMGECNSCEQKEETRFWRWNEVPTGDEPTPILSPGADTRKSETTGLTPTPFPTPMVSIQTAPALPDPTGLDAALKVIGTANLFKDITGLDQTQKNALAALQTNTEAAKFYAGEASKLAQQQVMKDGGIDKSLQSIKQAQTAGLIDADQAKELTMAALQGLTGKAPPKTAATAASPVKEFIDSATKSPQSKLSVESEGEKVEVEKSATVAASSAAPVAQGYTSDASPQVINSVLSQLADLRDQIPIPGDGVTFVGNDQVARLILSDFEVDKDDIVDADRILALEGIGEMLNSDPSAEAYLIGRASQTGRESQNIPLSERRAMAAYKWLVDVKNVDPKKMKQLGVGALNPLHDRPGVEDPWNRSVELIISAPIVEPIIREKPKPKAGGNTKWEIAFDFGWGATGGAGLAFGIHAVELKDVSDPANPITRSGTFQGVGAGIGLSAKLLPTKFQNLKVLGHLPSGSFSAGATFESDVPLEFDDFDGCVCRLTSASASLLLGGGVAIMSFVFITTNPDHMNVGGFSGGSVGVGASSIVGVLNLFDP